MTESVWIVDDEPLIRAAIVAVLQEVGYDARGFHSAEELYHALVDEDITPDLLVLDHMLPDESGAQIVHSLRERAEYRDIQFLFLTAVSDEEAERLSDLGQVMRKPFDFRDFIAVVERRLAEVQRGESPSLG